MSHVLTAKPVDVNMSDLNKVELGQLDCILQSSRHFTSYPRGYYSSGIEEASHSFKEASSCMKSHQDHKVVSS